MKKIFKQIGILLLAVCMACCAVALVACGETEVPPGPGDTTKTYTATVLDPAGEPLEGVKVKWGTAGNAVTDKDGKASATLKSADYDVTLEERPRRRPQAAPIRPSPSSGIPRREKSSTRSKSSFPTTSPPRA